MLTINNRKGNFPSMLQTRKFNLVMVNGQISIAEKLSIKPVKVVSYTGKMVEVKW